MLEAGWSMEGLPSIAFDAIFVPGDAAIAQAFEGNGGRCINFAGSRTNTWKAIALCGKVCGSWRPKLALQADEALAAGQGCEKPLTPETFRGDSQSAVVREEKSQAIPA